MMPSKFETRFKTFALPILQREFNQPIKLIDIDGNELLFQCFLKIDDIGSGDGFSDVQGQLSIKSTTVLTRIQSSEIGKWTRARVRGQIFDVYAVADDQFGTMVFNIRRKSEEQANTNLYDLSGEQAVWHS